MPTGLQFLGVLRFVLLPRTEWEAATLLTPTDLPGRSPSVADEPFRFQLVKDDRVFIYHQHRHVVTLSGDSARGFLQRRGRPKNFKRGNERPTR